MPEKWKNVVVYAYITQPIGYEVTVSRPLMIKIVAFVSVFIGSLVLGSGSAMAQNCSSFSTCKQAVDSYNDGNTKLDRDKDGIPCESICGSNGENMPR